MGHRSRLVVFVALLVTACAGESVSVAPTVEANPELDLASLPEVDETLTGLVESEVAIRQALQEGANATLEATSAGFRERFDSDLADHAWSHLVDLADDADP